MIKFYPASTYQEAAMLAAKDENGFSPLERKELNVIATEPELVTSEVFGTGRIFRSPLDAFVFHYADGGVNIERIS